MRIAETSRIELRAKLGHSVFVPNGILSQSQMSLEQSIELRFRQAAPRSFVTAGFHRNAARRQANFAIAKPFEDIEKGQRSSEKDDGLLFARTSSSTSLSQSPRKKRCGGASHPAMQHQ